MPVKNAQQRKALFLSLIAAGVFLLGAALMPWLVEAQDRSLAAVRADRLPAASSFPAPRLALSNLEGDLVSLQDFPGQVVLVNNWATWCPPCRSEMPALEAYFEEHDQDGFVILAIDSGDSARLVYSFVQEFGLTFTILLDPNGSSLEAFQNWNLPSTYIIDREGMLVLSWTGEINLATLETYVTPLLER